MKQTMAKTTLEAEGGSSGGALAGSPLLHQAITAGTKERTTKLVGDGNVREYTSRISLCQDTAEESDPLAPSIEAGQERVAPNLQQNGVFQGPCAHICISLTIP